MSQPWYREIDCKRHVLPLPEEYRTVLACKSTTRSTDSYWGSLSTARRSNIVAFPQSTQGWDKYSKCEGPFKVYLLQNLFLRSEAENEFIKDRSFISLKRSWWYRPTRSIGLWFLYPLPFPFLKEAQKPHIWVLWRDQTCPCVAWLTPLQATQS